MLELVGAGDRCARLKDHVRERARNYTKLVCRPYRRTALSGHEIGGCWSMSTLKCKGDPPRSRYGMVGQCAVG